MSSPSDTAPVLRLFVRCHSRALHLHGSDTLSHSLEFWKRHSSPFGHNSNRDSLFRDRWIRAGEVMSTVAAPRITAGPAMVQPAWTDEERSPKAGTPVSRLGIDTAMINRAKGKRLLGSFTRHMACAFGVGAADAPKTS